MHVLGAAPLRLGQRRPALATHALKCSRLARTTQPRPRSGVVVSSAVPSGQKPPASGRPAAGPDVAIEEEGEAEALEDEGGGDTADYLFEDLDELSEARHIVLVDDFLPSGQAKSLREVFDRRFADPRATAPERFVWDYWHIPEQYTLIRTQAAAYFPPKLYRALEDALLEYGEEQLGCKAISTVWMSYYVDGCVQELHCDNPHGPFAYVVSLTPWEGRSFEGGETMILKPGTLNYWESYEPDKGMEVRDLMTFVEPLFNRMTVFDPRFPHGVRRVSGTRDPRKARLVLHGWFTEPSPFCTGALSAEDVGEPLQESLDVVYQALEDAGLSATGTLILRLNVSGADGSVKGLEWLADTLIELPSPGAAPGCVRAAIQHIIYEQLLQAVFPTPAINGGSSAEGGGSVRAAAEPPTAPRGAGGSGGGAASDDKDSRITIPFVFQ